MSEVTLNIEGMHCGGCVRRVTQALERIPGAEIVEVRIGAARVKTDDPALAVAALAKSGYIAYPESPEA
jgi:copper chaperone